MAHCMEVGKITVLLTMFFAYIILVYVKREKSSSSNLYMLSGMPVWAGWGDGYPNLKSLEEFEYDAEQLSAELRNNGLTL